MAQPINWPSYWGEFRNSVESKLLAPTAGYSSEQEQQIVLAMNELRDLIERKDV